MKNMDLFSLLKKVISYKNVLIPEVSEEEKIYLNEIKVMNEEYISLEFLKLMDGNRIKTKSGEESFNIREILNIVENWDVR